MTLAQQIAEYLDDLGIGVMQTSLFYSYLPDTDSGDFTIAVLDTGGINPDIYIPTKNPTFQVFIRAANYDLGREKLDAIRAALHKQHAAPLVAGGTYVYYTYAQAEGGHVGRNESGKDEFSINFYGKIR